MYTLAQHVATLAKLGVARQFRAGSVILREGEAGDALYLLLKGQVLAYSQAVNGKVLNHSTIDSGHYFGEMALDGGSRSASVKALTDCECVLIPNAQVLAYAHEHAHFGTHLLNTVIQRARSSTEAAKSMALQDVYERLWQVLEREFVANQETCTLTHAQIAAQIGASREMVSKLIKDLVSGGYVQVPHRGAMVRVKQVPIRW